jgi:acyl-CoA synthetase (AMP-forming)/AMP-acid ligase II
MPARETVHQMNLARNTLGILERTALSSLGTRTALEFDGRAQTFVELHDRSLRLASGLAGLGVRQGDCVAVLLANRFEWPEALFALAGLGAICVPVNILLRAGEIDYVLEDAGATVLIADEAAAGVIGSLASAVHLVRVGALEPPAGMRSTAYEELVAAGRPQLPGAGPDLDDTAMLYYTSGTTGKPKAAEHTHGGVLWNSFTQLLDLALTPEDAYLVVPSLSWAAGFHDLVLPLVWIGGRSVLMPTGGTSVDRIASTVEATGSTHALLVPTLLKQLLQSPADLARLRDSSLRWIISGAEPVPVPVIESMIAELPSTRIVQGYGLSEFPTIATALRPEQAISHVGSAGRPMSIVELAIETADDIVLREGEGEIVLRSPATMRGYWRRPEETAEAFRGGWLHTGDLGVVDVDGFVTITGRKKDMIISGGLNVYPKEIEEVIYGIDGIAEAAVVGVPDERWGEMAVAIVVPSRPGLDPAEIDRACREALATYKCPRRIVLRDEPLPRNMSGKVLKRELRPWVAHELGVPEE